MSLVSYGRGVFDALTAAGQLAEEGIDAEVLDLRTLVPLDTAGILRSVGRTTRAVVVHHATTFAGPGAEVAAVISEGLFGQLAAPVQRVGAAFTPIPSAQALEAATFPSVADIVAAARRTLGRADG